MSLQRYLAHIGVPEASVPDLLTLSAIVAGHTRSIPFENLDPLTRRDVALDAGALTAKLVDGGRGGWCFEHNNLLRNALDELGYRTTGLAARVAYRRPAEAPPAARGHMLLRVDELPGGPHLVDVGFGGLTLTGVLRLEPELVQETPHNPYRLVPDDRDRPAEYTMEAQVGGAWTPLYRFGPTPQLLVDYEVSNFYLNHHPASQFLSSLMVARADPDRLYGLADATLSVHHLGGPSERTRLESVGEIRAALETHFHIALDGLDGLDERLQQILDAGADADARRP